MNESQSKIVAWQLVQDGVSISARAAESRAEHRLELTRLGRYRFMGGFRYFCPTKSGAFQVLDTELEEIRWLEFSLPSLTFFGTLVTALQQCFPDARRSNSIQQPHS
jgi:hypothetical protein